MDYAEWLRRLREDTAAAFEELYRANFKKIQAYVNQNSGTLDDAKDIFQESAIVLYEKSISQDFDLTANPGSYLYRTAANKWLNHLKKRKITTPIDDQINNLVQSPEENEIEDKRVYDKKEQLAFKVFEKIGAKCQQLLEYIYFEKLSHEEIAKRMGYGIKSIKVTKFRCLANYRKRMGEDPDFNQLFD